MGLAFYKPIFEKLEGTVLPSHSSAGLAGVSIKYMNDSLFSY
jgi:solute carrier family 25 citrate transporter 1